MEQALPLLPCHATIGIAMDTVKVTYLGASNRRRARGKTESYWFGRQTTLRIPASDVASVTGSDPEHWRVEWPKAPEASARRNRRPNTKTARSHDKPPVNEE